MFICLAANSSYPQVKELPLTEWTRKAKIIEDNFSVDFISRSFIAANFQMSENPKFFLIGAAFVRFEFWEFLVRIAKEKYMTGPNPPTFSQATAKLIEEKVLKCECEPWQSFRDTQLWTIDVNDILEANLKNLEKIYQHYFTPVKKYIDLNDLIDMIVRQADLGVADIDIQHCYGMCKMVVTDEPKEYKKYTIM